MRPPQLLQPLWGERQVSCRDRRGLLSDLIIALKQMPLEVRCNEAGAYAVLTPTHRGNVRHAGVVL